MVYTIIYKDTADGTMGTFTFVSQRHDKNYAWAEFKKRYAECHQEPIAMMPGQAMIYLPDDVEMVTIDEAS
tara:strand:- start:463 stop:675 length:213 start_codon:yes stop_codon:yes gene_type:complete